MARRALVASGVLLLGLLAILPLREHALAAFAQKSTNGTSASPSVTTASATTSTTTTTTTTTRKFSKNQRLDLPLTAGSLPVQFIVRGLEPSNRVDQQGTVYVGSIRGVPGGVDVHRWSPKIDGPPNADGTLPF